MLPRLLTASVLAIALALPAGAAASAPTIAPSAVWATVNVCDTAKSPDTIGIRASMPGIHARGAVMWVRFSVQYRTAKRTWKAAPGLATGYLRIGRADVVSRQAGHSFVLKAPSSGSFLLRGVVQFQWRTKANSVIATRGRLTTAGHKSTAGADPPGYSAATCTIS